MNKSLNISQIVRKRIALLLLINFLLTTILFSFPKEECNSMCAMNSVLHNSEQMQTTCSCDMSSKNGQLNLFNQNKNEFTKNNCDYKFTITEGFTFLIPNVINSKIIFTALSIIGQSTKQIYSIHRTNKCNYVCDVGPPIYISVSSFLI